MWEMIGGLAVTAVTIIGFVYAFLRNFKSDMKESMHNEISEIKKKIDIMDERIFWLATGRKLSDAILEEKMKEAKK